MSDAPNDLPVLPRGYAWDTWRGGIDLGGGEVRGHEGVVIRRVPSGAFCTEVHDAAEVVVGWDIRSWPPAIAIQGSAPVELVVAFMRANRLIPPTTTIFNAEGGEQPATEHPSGNADETSSVASAKLQPEAPSSAAETSPGMMELFHRCWGRCTASPSYNKEDWKKLQRLLERRVLYLAEIGGYEESEIVGVFSSDEKAVEAMRRRWGAFDRADECTDAGSRIVHYWEIDREDDERPTYFWGSITTYEIDGDGEP